MQEAGDVAEEDDDDDEAKLNVYANAVASAELRLRGGGGGDCGSTDPTREEDIEDVRLAFANIALILSGETRYARPCLPVNPLLMI